MAFNNLGLQEPSTITARVATVTIARGSTTEHQEILVIGDPNTSNAQAAVLDSTPGSTAWALAVREVVPQSTIVMVSTGSVRVVQSSAAELNVTVAGYSTIATVSTGSVRVVQSSATELLVTATLGTNLQSTAVPAANSSGLVVWPIGYSTIATVSTGSVRVVQSSASELNVTVAGYSTIATVSTGSVRVVQSSAAELLVTATLGTNLQSTSVPAANSSGIVVWPVGYSTVATVSTGSVRVVQSSAAELNVTVAGYSTTANISSLSGRVQVAPSDTNWASSAGFHFTSSGELQISPVSITGFSTITTVSTGSVRVVQSSASELLMTATIGTNLQSTSAPASNSSGIVVWQVGYSTVVSVSTGSVRVVQSSAAELNVTVAGYSTIATVSTGSVRVVQSSASELLVTATIGTNLQSTSVPAANSSGIVVWPVGYSTVATVSTGSVRVVQSSASELLVTATIGTNLQSTSVPAANSSGIVVWPVGYSTIVTVSTGSVRVIQSSASELLVTNTIGVNLQSTVAPSSGSSGLVVRQVIDAILTTASTNAFGASTSLQIQSSGAALRSYVVAYSMLSTNAGPSQVVFYSSNNMVWPMMFAAVSSAVSGANLAVSSPSYLFRTNASEELTLRLGGGAAAVAGHMVAVSYFRAP